MPILVKKVINIELLLITNYDIHTTLDIGYLPLDGYYFVTADLPR